MYSESWIRDSHADAQFSSTLRAVRSAFLSECKIILQKF